MTITIFYDYADKLPLIFIQNYDSIRFLGYVLPFSTFERSEMDNRFEYLSGGVRTLGGGDATKTYENVQWGGGLELNDLSDPLGQLEKALKVAPQRY